MKIPRFVGYLVVATVTLGFVAACGDDEVTPPMDNPPTIQLTSPAGGEALQQGGTIEIAWAATDDNMVVGVDLSYTAEGAPRPPLPPGRRAPTSCGLYPTWICSASR
jgi:hypothetical protein